MLLGARTGAWSGWKNPYITDGLVLMMDAEWINGPKKTSLAQWDGTVHDLVSGKSITLYNGGFYDQEKKEYGWKGGSGSGGFYSTKIAYPDSVLSTESTVESVAYGSGVGVRTYGDMYPALGYFSTLGILRKEGDFGYAHTKENISGKNTFHNIWRVPYSYMIKRGFYRVESGDAFSHGQKFSTSGGVATLSGNVAPSAFSGVPEFFCGSYDSNATCYVSSVRVYNRLLTEEEKAHNYAIDKERFGLP